MDRSVPVYLEPVSRSNLCGNRISGEDRASGGDYQKIRFTFQEYFRRMTEDPHRWSQPFAALLGAYNAQLGFGLPSIGGKDSMSGSFEALDVPPTLVASP